jgi:hypothetical protein
MAYPPRDLPRFSRKKLAVNNLKTLLDALNASQTTLIRDFHRYFGHVGEYAIHGTYGHIYSDGDGFLLCIHTGESARRWSAIKRKLTPFCRLTQDGDDEGCLHLDHLPTPHEAKLIRDALRIRKRRSMSPEAQRKARSALERFRASLNEGFPPKDASECPKGIQVAPKAVQAEILPEDPLNRSNDRRSTHRDWRTDPAQACTDGDRERTMPPDGSPTGEAGCGRPTSRPEATVGSKKGH